MTARAAAVAVFALATSPGVALACSACRDPRDANQNAFLLGTILLSVLPLCMFAGIALWFRKRLREARAAHPEAEGATGAQRSSHPSGAPAE